MGPMSAPLWVGGLWWYFFEPDAAGDSGPRGRYRVLGWTFSVVIVLFILLRGKIYYAWPVFPMMFAAGGIAVESGLERLRLDWLKIVYAVVFVAVGGLLAPLTLPVLSPETFMAYQQRLHLAAPEVEHQRVGPLRNQLYADMFGWPELAEQVARAYYSLPPDIRARTAIAAGSYGTAAALDFFGPRYGLPKAISGHQNYWFWGTHGFTGESVLLLDDNLRRARQLCENPQVMGRVYHPYSREDEHFDIFWCHPLRWNLQEIWPRVRHWE